MRILGEIKQELYRFADSYAKAVKGGADVTSEKISEAVKETDQNSDIPIEKLISAVKSGVKHAGEHMVKTGVDFFEHRDEKEKNQ
ncbi:hypothetical protein [Cohnella terricola]|uniref:Uncharacterized protein n=1 Tax=Cohnella terricola TaxID=1289167 RepID=A0A559JDI0_9BACL|nr:hypothetical protein [Cohnella terricola]TVX97929.1 hypothetical protein FPZ45_16925 [Cohnella terricola]